MKEIKINSVQDMYDCAAEFMGGEQNMLDFAHFGKELMERKDIDMDEKMKLLKPRFDTAMESARKRKKELST